MEKGVPMDASTRAVRSMLRSMAPVRSIPYIQSFQLPQEEELVLIQCECRRRSVQEVALEHSMSVETVKRRRRSALRKISSMTQI